ncbi:MAG: DNA mismatch repair protein MutS [Nitrospirae bacterium]|nr:DNA mismatch repair protein MutS [Nitrospirota bacterium]
MSEPTPLMKQYAGIKERYPDAIVLFRLGDFYEMFGEDAEKASRILQIALTTRDRAKDNPLPMCGVPYFASDSYITRLIKAGHKVAVCEQMEDPKEAKGLVSREVVRVITPGTHTPENPKENTYIVSLFPSGARHGIAAADISTGEFLVFETAENIEDEVSRFEPKEILVPESIRDNIHYREAFTGFYISSADDWLFDYAEAYRTLLRHFRVSSLEGFGCEGLTPAISAAGALIAYLENTQRELSGFKKITALKQNVTLYMDVATQRNLELTHNLKDGTRDGSLLWVLDETLTPMGGRFLRNAIVRPLTDMAEIRGRHEAVEYLVQDFELLEDIRTSLRKVQDLERLASRVSSGSANARDLVAIKNSLAELPKLKKQLLSAKEHHLKFLAGDIAELSLLRDLIEKGIMPNPPQTVREGGIIRERHNQEVDALRDISSKGKDFIAEMELREKKRTGISSLKIGYNRIFGYYIEITKSNLDLVPDDYIRKQTLVGSERFVTPELKEYENKVLGSEERLKSLEYEVFLQILDTVREEADLMQKTANALAVVDFLASLSVVAKRHNYAKPQMSDDGVIEITDGRHPVLERVMAGGRFIPNSTYLDTADQLLHILTGPNMAGKSTYMRQIALIVLMAQMGSFVPATSAHIGLADRIFTRIGASDFLTKGQSTFMVEMIEAANIVNNATAGSLVILDEVGRGTSTFDGISIAWAIAEHIVNNIKARTLFATHYNELTELALTLDGVRNYNVSVREWGDEIIFLRKIEEGPADKSYGIQVARLAGIPEAIIERSKEVLNNLEKEELNETGTPKLASRKTKKKKEQLDLFSSTTDSLVGEILSLDTDSLTPEEALLKIIELKKKIKI